MVDDGMFDELEKLQKENELLKKRMQLLINIKNSVRNWDQYSIPEAVESMMIRSFDAICKLDDWEGVNYDFASPFIEDEHIIELSDIVRRREKM